MTHRKVSVFFGVRRENYILKQIHTLVFLTHSFVIYLPIGDFERLKKHVIGYLLGFAVCFGILSWSKNTVCMLNYHIILLIP